MINQYQAWSEYKHSLTFRDQRYVVIATKPIANPPNSAQLEGTLYHPQVTPGRCGDGHTHTRRRL